MKNPEIGQVNWRVLKASPVLGLPSSWVRAHGDNENQSLLIMCSHNYFMDSVSHQDTRHWGCNQTQKKTQQFIFFLITDSPSLNISALYKESAGDTQP